MSEPIDVGDALIDAIFHLEEIEDIYDLTLMRSRVATVRDEFLRPALKAVEEVLPGVPAQ